MSEPPKEKNHVDLKAGTFRWTHVGMDKHISQDLSKFTRCEMEDVEAKHPNCRHWLSHCILNSTLARPIKADPKPFLFTFLRHIELAVVEYGLARAELTVYLQSDEQKFSSYFRGLGHLEFSISRLCQATHLFSKAPMLVGEKKKIKYYEENDGTPPQRLHSVYNAIKHAGPEDMQSGQLHPVWLTNDGIAVFVSRKGTTAKTMEVLTYVELAGMLSDMANVAEQVANLRVSNDVQKSA